MSASGRITKNTHVQILSTWMTVSNYASDIYQTTPSRQTNLNVKRDQMIVQNQRLQPIYTTIQ